MTKKQGVPSKVATKKGRGTQVPGQFYGYSLQITRAVAHLLRAHEGQSVSVEHLDDVATFSGDEVVAEQDKSGLAHNPVADRSLELWKTLHNWVRAIREGALRSDAKFILYVAQDHHGSVVDRVHTVANKADAASLVLVLRAEFWGKAPKYSARTKLPSELAEHVNGVLQASDEVLSLLFASLTLESGTGSPNDDLLPLLAEKAISEVAREDVLKHLLGWAKRAIDAHIEKKRPAVLSWDDFHRQLVGAAKKFDRSGNLLAPTPADICQADIDTELRARTYIRQLEAVKCEEGELARAVNDFLRSAVDRTTWSERGDVLEGSFGEFEDGLERAWQSQKTRVEIEQKVAVEEERGRLVYANCMSLQMRLQGMDVPAYFVPGSFHTLADALRVGWHPKYRDVLPAATFAARADDPIDSVAKAQKTDGSQASTSPADEGGGV
jgi:hypothetical protein